jgi:hypothetical protein
MPPWSSLLGRHRLRAPAPSIVIAFALLLLALSWTCRATQRVVRGNITGWAVHVVLTVTSQSGPLLCHSYTHVAGSHVAGSHVAGSHGKACVQCAPDCDGCCQPFLQAPSSAEFVMASGAMHMVPRYERILPAEGRWDSKIPAGAQPSHRACR